VSFTAALFLSALVQPAAEDRPPEIVVTGRGLEAPAGEAVYAVTIVERERLALSPSSRLENVLRAVPGFQLFRRSDARSANPTSQGVTLRALGGNAASRVLVTLDGVPQADPFGGWIAWPALEPRRLGQVRVVRGGGGGAAGPGALAGSIELESAGPDELGTLSASLAGGSRNGIDAFATAGLELGGGSLTVSGGYASGDGFMPIVEGQRGPADRASAYRQGSVAFRGVAPIGAATELQANLLLFHDERERGTAFSDIRTDGMDASLRLVGSGRWAWSALAYVQTRSFYNSFASVDAARALATRTAEQYEVPSTGAGGRIELRPPLGPVSLRVGGDVRRVSGETRELFAFQGGTATRGRRAGGETLTAGLFAEAALESGPLTLTGGGRLDRWRIGNGHLREETLATGAALTQQLFTDRSGWEPTARGGLAWRAGGGVTARLAAYLGWRLPTLNELYRPFRVGVDATAANEMLAPERLRGGEVGLEWRQGAFRVAATAFANRIEGAIANVTLGTGPGTFPGVGFVAAGGAYRRRDNLDAVSSRGVEVEASVQSGQWSLTAGYAFADARVSASGAALPLDGRHPAQTPRHSGSLTVAWTGDNGARASLGAHYIGAQYEDDLNRQLLPHAFTLDATARWPVARGLAIEARAENLADARVASAISADGLIERATPRTLWLGLSFSR